MFSFSKRQIDVLSSMIQTVDKELLNWDYRLFHQVFGEDEFVWYQICAVNYYSEYLGYLDNYLRVGGDAWLKLADESHKLCLRNLNRFIRYQLSLAKEA